jgi:hypothetical protein
MHVTHRTVMETSAAVLAANVLTSRETAQAHGAKKLRACMIGDSNQGGHGHSLHLAWALQKNIEDATGWSARTGGGTV